MFKVFMFAKRRADLRALSHDEYVDFYETKRVPYIRRLIENGDIPPYLDQRRNYVLHHERANLTVDPHMHYDVVMEGTYQDRRSYETVQRPADDIGKAVLYQKETQPFDLGSRRYIFVEERFGGIPTMESRGEKHFKLFMFARRRTDLEGLSHEEYIDFYETRRVPIARKAVEDGLLAPYIDQRRNYILRDEAVNLNLIPYWDFHAIMEATYKDRSTYEATHRATKGVAQKALYQDESQPFDLESRRYLAVEERSGGIPTSSTPNIESIKKNDP